MPRPAIRVEALSKVYRLGAATRRHDTFGDALADLMHAPRRRLLALHAEAPAAEQMWALREVSFKVEPGEVVAVIGRNGAGKSTLLKLLSRITWPTAGCIRLRGRVASLLEVGTGFHPELSGRENIQLNGAILGMGRAEIARKFDEIVAFAEIARFLDTPVKRYSSGMYLRLAFAVAAHLEPEILIVDEVLAVGDAGFQKKCLAKIHEVAQCSGRTVLFVSHNLGAVRSLCQRGIVLHEGRLVSDGHIEDALRDYLDSLEESGAGGDLSKRAQRAGRGLIRLERVEVRSGDRRGTALPAGAPVRFDFHLSAALPATACIFTLYDALGQPVANFNSQVHAPNDSLRGADCKTLSCEIDELLIAPGRYRLNVAIHGEGELQDHVEGAAFLDVVASPVRGRPVSGPNAFARVLLPHRWSS